MPGPSDSTAETIIASATDLRTFPTVVARLMEVTQGESPPVTDIVRVLATDQALTGRVIRVANSALLGGRAAITTLEQAVMRLGARGIRRNALMVAIYDLFDGDIRSSGDLRSRIWLHNTSTACMVQLLAEHFRSPHVDEAVVAALLHDVGRTVMHRYDPAGYAEAVRHHRRTGAPELECERVVFGTDHLEVGLKLASYWNLPEVFTSVIAGHHSSVPEPTDGRPWSTAANLTRLACYLVSFAGLEAVPGLPADPIDIGAWTAAGVQVSEAAAVIDDLERTLNRMLSYFDLAPLPLASQSSLIVPTGAELKWEEAAKGLRTHVDRRMDDLASFTRAVTALPRSDDYDAVLEAIARTALAPLSFARTAVYVVAAEAGLLAPYQVISPTGPDASALPAVPLSAAEDPLASIAGGQPGRILQQAAGERSSVSQILDAMRSQAIIAVPVRGSEVTHGVLLVDEPDSELGPSSIDLNVLTAIAAQMGSVLDQALLARDFEREAEVLQSMMIHDRETGLYNRRFLAERLDGETARSRRTGRPFAVLVVRLTDYEAIAQAGDDARCDALNRVVEVVRRTVRASDVVARTAADAFAVLLLEAGREESATPIRSVLEALREVDVRDLAPAVSAALRIQWGAAYFPDDGSDSESLLRAAETSLHDGEMLPDGL